MTHTRRPGLWPPAAVAVMLVLAGCRAAGDGTAGAGREGALMEDVIGVLGALEGGAGAPLSLGEIGL